MKKNKKLKNILITASLGIVSLFFINTSLASETGKVNVETANLREEANANSKILTLLAQDKEVEILEKNGEWYKIKADNITGYLRKDIVTIEENASNGEQHQSESTVSENTQSTESVNAEETNKTQEQSTSEEQDVDNQSKNEKETKKEITIGKYQVISNTTIKLLPAINSKNLKDVKENSQVQVTEIINGWVSIETEEGKGWIRKEKIKEMEVNEQNEQSEQEKQIEEKKEEKTQEVQETKTMYINSSTVNLRKKADTTSEIVTTLSVNTEVMVIENTSNGWSKVKVNGKEGYVATTLLSSKKQESSRSIETPRKTETTTTPTTTTSSSDSGASVVATAKKYLGSSYVYGGSSPSGFDCSGFTSYVYKQFGITLNRTAAGQYSNGTAVSRSELKEGDLVMFGKSGINHVGVYIGGGRMVHAANPSRGVTTDTINSGYYNNNYVGARRIF